MNLGAVPLLADRAAQDARTPFVRSLAQTIMRAGDLSPAGNHDGGRAVAAALLAAVQDRVRFVRDESERRGVDTFTGARATWRRGYGDCDDSAPLLAALGLAAGLPAELVAMSPDGGPPTHVAAKLAGLWAETTIPGARLGEHPYAAAERFGLLDAREDLGRGLGALSPERHRWARRILTDAWKRVRGREPTLFEIQLAQAWSLHDASYGLGWGPACASSHNWGAIHARGGDPSCPWTDRYPDGTVYVQPMRVWPTDEAGAEAYIRQLSAPARPLTQAALERARSVRDVLDAMRRERYWGGFCPEASKKYGGTAVRGQPGSSAAADACHEEALDGSQGALLPNGSYLVGFRSMTAALGEPMPPLRDGDPRDPAYGRSGGGGGAGLLIIAALAGGGYYAYRKGWFG